MTLQDRLEMLNEMYAEELAAIREDFKDVATLTALEYIEMKYRLALEETGLLDPSL